MNYQSLVLAASPTAAWGTPADPAATAVPDLTGNGHDAALQGRWVPGPSLIPGDPSPAFQFTGAGALALPALLLNPPFTLEAFVQATGTAGPNSGWATLFGVNSGRRVLWGDPSNGSRLLVQMGAANLFTASGASPFGQKLHIAYVADGVNETLYVNGAQAAQQHNAGTTWTQPSWVGSYGTPSYLLVGLVQWPAVYGRALDPAVIATHAAALTARQPGVAVMVQIGSIYQRISDGSTVRPNVEAVHYYGRAQPTSWLPPTDLWFPTP